MKPLISLILLFITISILLFSLSKLIATSSFLDFHKISPFECGFDPKLNARLPLSLQFFLTAIIFLIFDVEITLLLPIPLALNTLSTLPYFILTLLFILILLIGLYYEWMTGALNWLILMNN